MYAEKIKVALQHIAMKFNYLDPSEGVQCVDYKCMPIVYNHSHALKMEDSRRWLRKRGRLIAEQRDGWVPTPAAETDVAKTWAEYREQTQ